MYFGQAITGFLFFFVAADYSAIQGGGAASLGLPFSGLAQKSFWLVPAVPLLACLLPRRVPAWLRIFVSDSLMMGVVMFPLFVFAHGSRSATFTGGPPSEGTQPLDDELGFHTLEVGDSHSVHLYYPRSQDSARVREILRRHGLEPSPSTKAGA